MAGAIPKEREDAVHATDFLEVGFASDDEIDVAVLVEVAQRDPEGIHWNNTLAGFTPLGPGFLNEDLGAGNSGAAGDVEFAITVHVANRNAPVQAVDLWGGQAFGRVRPAAFAVAEPDARAGRVGGDEIEVAVAVHVGRDNRVTPFGRGEALRRVLPDALAVALVCPDAFVGGGDGGDVQAAVLVEVAERGIFGSHRRQPGRGVGPLAGAVSEVHEHAAAVIGDDYVHVPVIVCVAEVHPAAAERLARQAGGGLAPASGAIVFPDPGSVGQAGDGTEVRQAVGVDVAECNLALPNFRLRQTLVRRAVMYRRGRRGGRRQLRRRSRQLTAGQQGEQHRDDMAVHQHSSDVHRFSSSCREAVGQRLRRVGRGGAYQRVRRRSIRRQGGIAAPKRTPGVRGRSAFPLDKYWSLQYQNHAF